MYCLHSIFGKSMMNTQCRLVYLYRNNVVTFRIRSLICRSAHISGNYKYVCIIILNCITVNKSRLSFDEHGKHPIVNTKIIHGNTQNSPHLFIKEFLREEDREKSEIKDINMKRPHSTNLTRKLKPSQGTIIEFYTYTYYGTPPFSSIQHSLSMTIQSQLYNPLSSS